MGCSKAVLLVFFLGLLLWLSVPATAVDADFNYLNLTWPGSYCNVDGYECCVPSTGKPAYDFLIDGLYPANSTNGQIVSNCNDTCIFHVNALQRFIVDMYNHWSNLSCPSNNGVDMWRNTWCTYGTCSNFTQRDYFYNGIALFKQLDLLNVLQGSGITLSSNATYKLAEIQGVLAVRYSFSTVVLCNRDEPEGPSQLYQVVFCVDEDVTTPIHCPITLNSDCDDDVRFPPFPDYLNPFPHYLIGPDDEATTANPIKMPTDSDAAM